MSDLAELTLTDPIFFGPTFEAVPGLAFDFEDVHYVQAEGDATQYVFFLWATGCETGAFEAALTDDATVDSWAQLVEFDDRALYRVWTHELSESEAPLVYPLSRRHDVTVLDTHRDASGFHLRIRAPTREALKAFQSALTGRGATVEISRITADDQSGSGACPLTEKQSEALALAYEQGYFATPKEVTLSELAAEFGTTRQTLSHHVRSAVETLVARNVEPSASTSVTEEFA